MLLNKFEHEFIECYDKEVLTEEDLKLFDTDKLFMSRISLIMKHLECYKKIINSSHKLNLVFEDDVILNTDFKKKLLIYLDQLPEDYDMLFIGDGEHLHIPKYELKKNKFIYKKCNEKTSWGGHGATRCTDSYFISKKAAQTILDYVEELKNNNEKIDKPADGWLNDVIRKFNFKVYWAEPTIVTQATLHGFFKRTTNY